MDHAREQTRLLAVELEALRHRGLLTQPADRLISHFVHMHFNRLLGANPDVERLTLALLCRTREAIAHTAPAQRP